MLTSLLFWRNFNRGCNVGGKISYREKRNGTNGPATTGTPSVAGSNRPAYTQGTVEAAKDMANLADANGGKPGCRGVAAKLRAAGRR